MLENKKYSKRINKKTGYEESLIYRCASEITQSERRKRRRIFWNGEEKFLLKYDIHNLKAPIGCSHEKYKVLWCESDI